MALDTTDLVIEALGPDMAAVIDRKPDRRTQLADLHDEVLALRSERRTVATELHAATQALRFAALADRPDVVLHVAGRLDSLGRSLHRRGQA